MIWPFNKKTENVVELPFGEPTKKAVAALPPPKKPIKIDLLHAEMAAIDRKAIGDNPDRSALLLPCEKLSIMALKKYAIRSYFDACYNRISYDILHWRKKDRSPVFGIFDPFREDNTCVITANDGWSSTTIRIGGKPKAIDEHLREYYSNLKSGTEYSAAFVGFIPMEHRSTMYSLKRFEEAHHSDLRIRIIAECDWKTRAIPPDPLIVVEMDRDVWLVASFDTTPIERIASSEFTWKEPTCRDHDR